MLKRIFLISTFIYAFGLGASLDTKHIKSIDVTEISLPNGMKVVLKPTKFDPDEIFIRVAAPKGYVYLPEKLRPAAQSLHEIIWESGLGTKTGDQLSLYLFEHGVEVEFQIGPAERYLEGEGRVDGAPVLFQLIHDLFLLTRINEEQLPVIRTRLKESIERKSCDISCQFDALFLNVNTLNYAPLEPVASREIDLITVDNAQKVLLGAFQDPSEFVTVVVGDFSVDAILPMIEKTLGAIPVAKRTNIWTEPPVLTFPKGVETKILAADASQEPLTRISFPITAQIDESNIRILDLLTETIEARLKDALLKRFRSFYALDVSYEFPLYPFMDKPWITVQFRSEKASREVLTEIVLEQLKDLKTNGINNGDLSTAELLQTQSDDYWNADNQFWLSLLSQYYMMGWDKERILKNYGEEKVTKEQIAEAMKQYFPIDNYTIVTGGS